MGVSQILLVSIKIKQVGLLLEPFSPLDLHSVDRQAIWLDVEVLNKSGHGQVGCLVGPCCLHQRERCSSSSRSSSRRRKPVPLKSLFSSFSFSFSREISGLVLLFSPQRRSQSGTFLCVPAPKVEQPPAAEWGMLQICTIPYGLLYHTYSAVWSTSTMCMYNAVWYNAIWNNANWLARTIRTMPYGTIPYGLLYHTNSLVRHHIIPHHTILFILADNYYIIYLSPLLNFWQLHVSLSTFCHFWIWQKETIVDTFDQRSPWS